MLQIFFQSLRSFYKACRNIYMGLEPLAEVSEEVHKFALLFRDTLRSYYGIASEFVDIPYIIDYDIDRQYQKLSLRKKLLSRQYEKEEKHVTVKKDYEDKNIKSEKMAEKLENLGLLDYYVQPPKHYYINIKKQKQQKQQQKTTPK